MIARDWAIAFATTLVAELPVYLLACRGSFTLGTCVVVGLLLNVVTHPVAWSVFHFARISFPLGFVAVEAVVVVTEAVLLCAIARSRYARRPLSPSRCLAIAVAANSFSAGLSLLVWG